MPFLAVTRGRMADWNKLLYQSRGILSEPVIVISAAAATVLHGEAKLNRLNIIKWD